MAYNDFRMLIDGEAVAGSSSFAVIDPAIGEPFAACPKANRAQLDQAVAGAKAAFPSWAATPIEERAAALNRLADELERQADEFAALLTREQGKPLAHAKFEVMTSVGLLRACSAMRPQSRVLRDNGASKIMEIHKPLGVVAAIAPWNFPLILLMGKVGPALITGNTMVIKPAPTTPLTTLMFAEICRAELPAGVVNVICDQNDLGDALTSHPDVAKVAFTGSTATGSKVMASAAGSIKRVTLELGGNDAAIVLDDVDPAQIAPKIFQLAMLNAGQVCMAIKRVYVPAALYDQFCGILAAMATGVIVDSGDKPGTQIGPVQNASQYAKLKDLLAETRNQGTVIAGGAALDRAGYFIAPTIVRDIADEARLVREEQFGPILPILSYVDLEDAVERANASEFGLGASVWSADATRATDVAMLLDAGTVWVNQHAVMDPAIPFRGAKQSGLGGEMGQEGLHEYCQAHVISVISLEPAAAQA